MNIYSISIYICIHDNASQWVDDNNVQLVPSEWISSELSRYNLFSATDLHYSLLGHYL